MFIFIDEFGKILEHAANNNPEKELYFLQTLAEFVNVSSRNVILITTLHQNFGSYAHKLTETQRNEWLKVKGIQIKGQTVTIDAMGTQTAIAEKIKK